MSIRLQPLRALLVDDERLALVGLQLALAEFDDVEVVDAVDNAADAVRRMEELQPDIVLLDVQMPGAYGTELARNLPQDRGPEVVFVTAHPRYAVEAFQVDAADFILKPVERDRLNEALRRARRRWEMKRLGVARPVAAGQHPVDQPASAYLQEFWCAQRRGEVRVRIEQVQWIEAARDYVLIHTSLRSYIYKITMAALESRLDPAVMMRVHRSAFVRIDAVEEIVTVSKGVYALRLTGEALVRVGRLYAQDVLQAVKR